jgi:hypothetical protein
VPKSFLSLPESLAGAFCLSLACQAAASSWSEGQGFRSLEVQPVGSKAGFTSMAADATGVTFTNTLQGDAYATNAVAHNGAGVAVGDVDGDGWQDIYLCNLQGPNRLYRNLGNWRFEEIPIGEAACASQFSTGAALADVDGDGDLDLLVNGIAAGTRLFLNDGKGAWVELKDSGLSRTASATSLALADIDSDGDLDLYCTHYIDVMHLIDPTTRFSVIKRSGKWTVLKVNDYPTSLPWLKDRFEALPDGRVRELPEYHGLYRNDGKGRFTSILFETGVFQDEQGKAIPPYRDWGLAAMFRDMNGDGAPDLYVCNDNVSPDRIWINSGRGTFRAVDRFAFRHTSRSSMGVGFGDIDRDGHDDIIVVDMLAREHHKRMTQLVKDLPDAQEREQVQARPQYNRNTLFFGRPDGTYAEAALMAGVAATDWSWSPILIDVDLDGYEDLLVSNGFEFDVMDQDTQDAVRDPRRWTREQLKRALTLYPQWRTANAAFRNQRDGTFEPMSQQWGFDEKGISFGMALGDLDNDGDMDLVVNNLNERASLYRNNVTAGRIGVRLKGLPPNTQGVGARIKLVGGSITQSQEMINGGRYVSGDQAMRVFAADANSQTPLRLEVTWRNGHKSILTNVQANRIYEVDQKGANPKPGIRNPEAEEQTFFKDVSSLLGHVHIEDSFDDWALQPSLPRRLSRLGPGVSWFDVDADGWQDLIIGAATGGKLAIYRSNKGQSFTAVGEANSVAPADQTTVLGWSDAKGNRKLLFGMSNHERPEQESEIAVHSLTNAPLRLGAGKASIGPMAIADIDADGDLDLFVGGRFTPARYPEPVSSSIWINDGEELKVSPVHSEPFQSIGLVSGATFADLDGDGRLDLALALEWGPVRVFRNDNGRFQDMTSQWGLADRSGWWTGIASGDFDGDGRMDLAVGNWGRNSMYELQGGKSLRVFYGDWNSDGRIALIEAWQSGADWFPIHNRTWLAATVPELAKQFATHQTFSKATVKEILGPRSEKAKSVEATELRSGIFLNRRAPDGNIRFDWAPLPRKAQIAPAFSVNIGDFDGDGNEDLFLSQNFFSAVPENSSAEALSRDDAGRGLWLRGSGRGTFTAVDGSITGIKVYGEQRGAALADYNHDGRVDVCVSQNNGTTKLYANQGARRGLRVTLRGPAENPDAVGAQMRVRYADGGAGSCRHITAGTGYWSQDAAPQVLGLKAGTPPEALWIRWPDGSEETFALEPGVLDVIRAARRLQR